MRIHEVNKTVNFKSIAGEKIAREVGEYVLTYRRPFKKEVLSSEQKEYLLSLIKKRVLPFIAKEEPINMAIVGFSLKCPSPVKVISPNADRAEFEALRHLQSFTDGFSRIYKPGAKLDIFADGRMFARSIIGFTDEKVSKYVLQLKDFLTKLKAKNVKIYTPEDFYSGNFDVVRKTLVQEFPTDVQKVNSDLFTVEYIRFMRDFYAKDIRAQDRSISIKESKKIGARVAEEVINMADSYSSFVASLYKKGMLRFSVHGKPTLNSDGKIGIFLNSLKENCPMPWHGAAIRLPQDSEYFLYEKKNLLEQFGATFVPNLDGKGAYYQFPTIKPYNPLLSLKENLSR